MSDQPPCKTCRWWDRQRNSNTGDCRCVEMRVEYVEIPTRMEKWVAIGFPRNRGRNIRIIQTHATFGCIHHEPR